MRFISVVLMTVGLTFVTACPELRNSAASPNINNSTPTPEVHRTPQRKSGKSIPEIAVFDLRLTSYEKKQKKIYDEVFSFYGWAKVKKGEEFDIMNEYGFLAKGRFIKYVNSSDETDGHWIVEIIRDSLRPDLDKLSQTRMMEMEKENPTIPAYGVYPSKPERKNIRSGDKVDMSEKGISERQTVFLSLPEEVRDKANVYSEKRELEYPNRWADLDGDGKIDFVCMRIRCSELPHSHCGKYLSLTDGGWTELIERLKLDLHYLQ